jgi:hypothetical protein
MKNKIFPILVILGAVLIRFLPHPANVVPITAMALFCGAYLNKKYAIFLPLAVMLISDLFLGFHKTILFVYGSFLIASIIGIALKDKVKIKNVIGASLLSSIIFYVITNFGVWLTSGMYEMTGLGLIRCYVLAIPFFRNTLVGDLFYTAMIFGGYELVCKIYRKAEIKS